MRVAWLAAILGSTASWAIPPNLGEALQRVDLPERLEVRDAPETRRFTLKRADDGQRDGSRIRLVGNVQFTIREFEVEADRVEGDLTTEVFTLTGRVRVISPNISYAGEEVGADFKNRLFSFKNAASRVSPELIQGRLQGDLFVRGRAGDGGERQLLFFDAHATTCDLDHPHFDISARKMDIRPGDRLALSEASIRVGGRRILTLPQLNIPLDQRAPRYVPETGQSRDEGYFVKSRWGVPLAGDDSLDARVDLMTKLGLGFGPELRYRDSASSGALDFYTLVGPQRTVSALWQHAQQFRFAELNLNASYNQANYLTAPNTTQLSVRSSVSVPIQRRPLRIALNYNDQRTANFRSQLQNLLLSDQREYGRYQLSVDLNHVNQRSRSGSAIGIRREVLEVRTRASRRFNPLDAELSYLRSIPISETVNFFSGTDQTPLLTLRSDARRLLGEKFGLPFTTELSLGELIDPIRRRPLTRALWDLVVPGRTIRAGPFNLNLGGRFRQAIYSDDTAQFVLGLNGGLSYRLAEGSSLNVRYDYLRPQGFAPLAMDRTGRSDLFGVDLAWKALPSLRVAAQTGYDLLAPDRGVSPWQTVGLRFDWAPSEGIRLQVASTYDTLQSAWNNVRIDFGLAQREVKVLIGARYDGLRHTWGAVNLYAEGLRWGRLKTALVLAYNGYSRRFESRQFSFVYDLHCTEAILEILDNRAGFRPGTQVAFYLRVKALPFNTPFGLGTRGQGIGTGTGIGF